MFSRTSTSSVRICWANDRSLTLCAGQVRQPSFTAVFQSVTGLPYRGLGEATTPTTRWQDSANSRNARMPADSSPTNRMFMGVRYLFEPALHELSQPLHARCSLPGETVP